MVPVFERLQMQGMFPIAVLVITKHVGYYEGIRTCCSSSMPWPVYPFHILWESASTKGIHSLYVKQ